MSHCVTQSQFLWFDTRAYVYVLLDSTCILVVRLGGVNLPLKFLVSLPGNYFSLIALPAIDTITLDNFFVILFWYFCCSNSGILSSLILGIDQPMPKGTCQTPLCVVQKFRCFIVVSFYVILFSSLFINFVIVQGSLSNFLYTLFKESYSPFQGKYLP